MNDALTSSLPVIQLIDKIRQARSWREVEAAIAVHPEYKTEAWRQLTTEERSQIKKLKQQATEASMFRIGDRVLWPDCPGALEFLTPFRVRAVEGESIWLDWIHHPIPRYKLILEERSP